MRTKSKIVQLAAAFVLAFGPIIGTWESVSAEPGNFFLTFDNTTVRPGQQDVPAYVRLNSNGTSVTFAGCELDVDSTKAAYSHGLQNYNGFTTDFSGPNGDLDGGGMPDQRLFYGNAVSPVAAGSNIEVYVLFYDISGSASGAISVDFDTADSGNCLITDGSSNPFATINGTSGTLNVSGVTVTESGGSTNVTEGGATDTYSVVLDAEPTSNVTIDITGDAETNVNTSSLVPLHI